ncbi:hypothetical protein Taro_027236, partial [Colocasia esculenta]|nr:hypothetical protein [Colocasia esculenta]
ASIVLDAYFKAYLVGPFVTAVRQQATRKQIPITQKTQEIYPGLDLLSTGVLRLVPKQYLGISLTEGIVPLKDTTTPWIPHQVFFSFPGKKAAHFFYRLRSKPPGSFSLSLSVCGVETLVVFEVCDYEIQEEEPVEDENAPE